MAQAEPSHLDFLLIFKASSDSTETRPNSAIRRTSLVENRTMLDSVSNKTLPPEATAAIREQCEQFEAAWQAGKQPMLDDYLGDVQGVARDYLVRELTNIAQRYRLLHAGPAAAEATMDLGTVMPQMPVAPSIAPSPARDLNSGLTAPSRSLPTHAVDMENTVAHSNQTMAPTGRLVIRCPHCCNGVELLAETPFEDITCHDCGSTFNLVDREKLTTAAAAPKAVGRFQLERKLGAGGFGTVWLARDGDLDRIVAIKIPRKGQLSPTEMEQFYREARAAAQLRHPNIVPVHEVGRDGDTVFIVSDYIEGESLSDWVTGRRMNNRDVAQMSIMIADALHHAHQQGIIHRDFKPSNVMIDGADQPHLMDFGLARREAGEVTMTVDGQILGTPTYMSPEQASGQGHWADRRTDIYSFGVMLFKLLTDELPFRGSIQRQIQQRLTDDAPDPRSLNRFIPRDLATIVLKCLERDPNKRYLTAAALADELRRFLRGEPIKARPISRVARMARWAKRKPAAATAIALATLLAIGGPLVTWSIEQQRQTLAANLIERNNIIARNAVEAKRDGATITRLQGELDLWEGRANPWKFWPPEPTSHPRKIVLNKFFADQYPTLSASLNSNKYNSHELAAGNLGLALMAEKLKKSEVAEQHLLAAKELLETLSADEPANESYQLALAQCLAKLAQVYGDKRRDEAAELLAEATTIYKQLATSQQREPDYKVDWLATELFSGTLAGFEAAKEHLQQATEIEKLLPQVWPTDPLAVYNFAAYLTEEAPVLGASPK
ncbi:MAG: serine/threonine-protein kinase [Bythopirellula sp.]|nr:serine/threonine-protein kinase [Bythopirellula sp.]